MLCDMTIYSDCRRGHGTRLSVLRDFALKSLQSCVNINTSNILSKIVSNNLQPVPFCAWSYNTSRIPLKAAWLESLFS